ncbi:hypothetical protein SAMN05421780_105166 [Flexibacter flexilis DSM 6793]|uniref:Reverse transcriptase (RNA-dependent DNA polymerase) n=1 Tax=Flexibacter flexilis DSM 6793 TaxID=927664 RepID=A0A1I1J2E6_9BACT|nr:hypothetical protein [Flexibacter flexilis]SFC42281.1 hypothetical protein SAMN05421780_105166 [Flexibacter flexilis DSM 6793]
MPANINYLYNFKNPIRYFIQIDNLQYPRNIENMPIDYLAWSEPFKFRIKKTNDSKRTLKIPNILNFNAAYYKFKNYPHFDNIQESDDKHKRLSADLEIGEFKTGEFERQLALDFNNLSTFDTLLKVDIKEYYGRIYTHKLDFAHSDDERFLSNLNIGATNGLLMGNYLSLYFAEKYLSKISKEIEKNIEEKGINCKFSYFSDDFYFFCNKRDHKDIISLYEKILDNYELERNDLKVEIWTYETFNSYNIIERYWRKIVSYCNEKIKAESSKNKLVFINQIIYRIANIQDDKMKKTFINNFFKNIYFVQLDLSKFMVTDYNNHQLLYLYKLSPEALLYSISKFRQMNKFDYNKFKLFFEIRYEESLKDLYHDEQLYYYFAIKIYGFDDLLQPMKELVIKSENQVLISYYLKENLFSEEDLSFLQSFKDEKFWFQNYHLIIFKNDLRNNLTESITKYLVPKSCKKEKQKENYINFYKDNIVSNNTLIRDINNVDTTIKSYLEKKINKEADE